MLRARTLASLLVLASAAASLAADRELPSALPSSPPSEGAAVEAGAGDGEWLTDLARAEALAAETERPLLIVFR